jgi:hypothetical protein
MIRANWHAIGLKIGDAIKGLIAVGVVYGLGMWALGDAASWLPDTPAQHQERLECEMIAMQGTNGDHPMSADKASAYCDRMLQLEREANERLHP